MPICDSVCRFYLFKHFVLPTYRGKLAKNRVISNKTDLNKGVFAGARLFGVYFFSDFMKNMPILPPYVGGYARKRGVS